MCGKNRLHGIRRCRKSMWIIKFAIWSYGIVQTSYSCTGSFDRFRPFWTHFAYVPFFNNTLRHTSHRFISPSGRKMGSKPSAPRETTSTTSAASTHILNDPSEILEKFNMLLSQLVRSTPLNASFDQNRSPQKVNLDLHGTLRLLCTLLFHQNIFHKQKH
jgi:hypothetical protein